MKILPKHNKLQVYIYFALHKVNYLAGNYGYGHAKQALFELIVDKFRIERERYTYYMTNLSELDDLLQEGARRASVVANEVLGRVRMKLGFR